MNIKRVTFESPALNEQSEKLILAVYATAEQQDTDRYSSLFTVDGELNDISAGRIYRGKTEIGNMLDIYSTAFPDMHRELYAMYVMGDTVIVELSLNGTHSGPLVMPSGTIHATGNRIQAPCCDVFRITNGKVKVFNCYTAATILLGQLGVLSNLGAAFNSVSHHSSHNS